MNQTVMNQTPLTSFDVTLADGEHVHISAEKVFVADGSLVFSVVGRPTLIFAMGEWRRVAAAPIPANSSPPTREPRILTQATEIPG